MDDHVLVIGAGPAGLSCAAVLGQRGISATVLERAARVGQSWRERPDGMRLNSGRGVSALPGQRYPRRVGTFPGRDDVVGYLDRYAERLRVRTGVSVRRVSRDGDRGWQLETSTGRMSAPEVVVATGQFLRPRQPHWPGADQYTGDLLHAADYRAPAPFRDRDVLVVGPGASGMEIAAELARDGAHSVFLSVRTPPNLMPRFFGALPGVTVLLRLPTRVGDAQARVIQALTIGDLSGYGLPTPAAGPFTQLRALGAEPTAVDRSTLRAIRAGRIGVVSAVTDLETTGARLADGTRLEVDAVVAATGFGPDLDSLVGHLDVLDESRYPRPAAQLPPGLHFIGFDRLPGQLVFLPGAARRIATRIAARRPVGASVA